MKDMQEPIRDEMKMTNYGTIERTATQQGNSAETIPQATLRSMADQVRRIGQVQAKMEPSQASSSIIAGGHSAMARHPGQGHHPTAVRRPAGRYVHACRARGEGGTTDCSRSGRRSAAGNPSFTNRALVQAADASCLSASRRCVNRQCVLVQATAAKASVFQELDRVLRLAIGALYRRRRKDRS